MKPKPRNWEHWTNMSEEEITYCRWWHIEAASMKKARKIELVWSLRLLVHLDMGTESGQSIASLSETFKKQFVSLIASRAFFSSSFKISLQDESKPEYALCQQECFAVWWRAFSTRSFPLELLKKLPVSMSNFARSVGREHWRSRNGGSGCAAAGSSANHLHSVASEVEESEKMRMKAKQNSLLFTILLRQIAISCLSPQQVWVWSNVNAPARREPEVKKTTEAHGILTILYITPGSWLPKLSYTCFVTSASSLTLRSNQL